MPKYEARVRVPMDLFFSVQVIGPAPVGEEHDWRAVNQLARDAAEEWIKYWKIGDGITKRLPQEGDVAIHRAYPDDEESSMDHRPFVVEEVEELL